MAQKKSMITLLLLLTFMYGNAQVIEGVEIETDPTYYFNKGYSADVAIATKRTLWRILPYQTDVPSFLQGSNKEFKQTMIGFASDFDYYLKKETKGLFLGFTYAYSKDRITDQTNNQQLSNDHSSIGIRFGYRWFPFEHKRKKNGYAFEHGLFLTPFVAPIYNIANDINFTDRRTFRYNAFFPFGGVHIGWKFNFKQSKKIGTK